MRRVRRVLIDAPGSALVKRFTYARTRRRITAGRRVPATANRPTVFRCGSCGRPAGRCRSTGRLGRASPCWKLPAARPGRRDHPAAGTPARRRRGDPLQRHRGAARRRPGSTSTSCPAPVRWSPSRSARPPTWRASARSTAATSSTSTRRSGAGRRAGRHPADRLRRCAVHPGQLPGRGRPVADPRQDQGADVRRRRTLWHALCDRLAEITLTFLRVQIEAGRRAVQLFDSWAGALSEADYRRYVQPHSATVLAAVADAGVPRIHFGVGTGELLDRDGRGRRRRGRRGLAYAAGRGDRPRSARPTRCRATSTRRCCRRRGRCIEAEVRRVLAAGARGAGPRLQPRSRRTAGDRSGGADPDRRAGAHRPDDALMACRASPASPSCGGGITGLAAARLAGPARLPGHSRRGRPRDRAASSAPGRSGGRPVRRRRASPCRPDGPGGALRLVDELGMADLLVHPDGGEPRLLVDGASRATPPKAHRRCRRTGDLGGDRRTGSRVADGDADRPAGSRPTRDVAVGELVARGSATRWSSGWSIRCSAACTPGRRRR